MALLEEGGREFEANTHPRAMHECMDSSGWPALPCRRSSVSRSRQRLRVLPAFCQHYGQTPPVDPADHNERGDGFGCSAEGYYPTSLFCTPRSYRCLSLSLSLIGLPPFYGYPSRGLNQHCALSSLSPTTHTMGMGGNRLLRGIVLERLPNLGLNCGSISVAQFPRTCYREAEVFHHLCFRRTRLSAGFFVFLRSNLHPIPNDDPALDLKKNIKRISWSRFRPQPPNFLSFVF